MESLRCIGYICHKLSSCWSTGPRNPIEQPLLVTDIRVGKLSLEETVNQIVALKQGSLIIDVQTDYGTDRGVLRETSRETSRETLRETLRVELELLRGIFNEYKKNSASMLPVAVNHLQAEIVDKGNLSFISPVQEEEDKLKYMISLIQHLKAKLIDDQSAQRDRKSPNGVEDVVWFKSSD